ncbi:unnamed protein product [Fraxinus pennsylvanica]|uniref:Uncharacterized protein n=1 Tax=Fraxinus pennsylvanica TaxID=56036 RepID=A0AAD1Z976_9LAMI|nr:unnamed protein product [Fraxinus pennsylvanica]
MTKLSNQSWEEGELLYSYLGYAVLAVQAHFQQQRPFPCKGLDPSKMSQCEPADRSQQAMLFTGIHLVALGTGGVKAALPSLGADQFDERDSKEAASLSSFFNCFGNVTPVSKHGEVFVAAIKNRNLSISDTAGVLHEIHDKEAGQTEILQRTDQVKFLDRAAIVKSAQETSKSSVTGSWKLCTFTGIPTGITQLQRVGVGLVLAAISMAIAGIIETHRRNVAINHNMVDSADPLPISIFWLRIRYAIFGMADMFTLVGFLEFFYAKSSSGMKSLSTAILQCSLAFGYFTSSVVVNVVNKVSGGWLASNNLNRDKLNYFYLLLTGLSIVNFGFYLLCASWYKYKKVEGEQVDNGWALEERIESIDMSIVRNNTP